MTVRIKESKYRNPILKMKSECIWEGHLEVPKRKFVFYKHDLNWHSVSESESEIIDEEATDLLAEIEAIYSPNKWNWKAQPYLVRDVMYGILCSSEPSQEQIVGELEKLSSLRDVYLSDLNELSLRKRQIEEELDSLSQVINEIKAEHEKEDKFEKMIDQEIESIESLSMKIKKTTKRKLDPFEIAKDILDMSEEEYNQIREDV